MSGSASLPTTPFADAEKADIRRFCGYEAYGAGNSGFQGWRFFQAYGMLEYRLNNLAPAELQVVRYLLAQLYTLEAAVWGSSANLMAATAGPYTHNPREVQDREGLYRNVRMKLCGFLGVPPGAALNAATVSIVI